MINSKQLLGSVILNEKNIFMEFTIFVWETILLCISNDEDLKIWVGFFKIYQCQQG